MEKEELNRILINHKLWLNNDSNGKQANLKDANLKGAFLSGVNLNSSYLAGANLEGANLTNATLISADIRGANLNGANLKDAFFIRANLNGANLNGANLSGTELRGSELGVDKTIISVSGIGSARRITTYWIEENKVWCGCFKGTLEEFEKRVITTHSKNIRHLNDYLDAITYFKSIRDRVLNGSAQI